MTVELHPIPENVAPLIFRLTYLPFRRLWISSKTHIIGTKLTNPRVAKTEKKWKPKNQGQHVFHHRLYWGQGYVVLPHGQDNCLTPHTLILDVTMTHYRHGRSTLHPTSQLTHTLSSMTLLTPTVTCTMTFFTFVSYTLITVYLTHLKGSVGLIFN